MSTTNQVTHQQAEAIFAELLKSGGREHLKKIFRLACREKKTPLGIIEKYGDPRNTKHTK